MAKVLLVEDDNNLREIYEARLQAEGYTINSAKDGEEALVVAKAEKPDLIISDVMMPKISGFEMLDILRNTQGLKETKVIMLTALGQSDDRVRADSLGADRYLVKSQVTLEDIVKAAHELLEDEAAAPEPAATPDAAAATPVSAPATSAPVPVAAEPPTQAAVAVTPAPDVPVSEPAAAPAAAPIAADTTASAAVVADPVAAPADTAASEPPVTETPSADTTAPAADTPSATPEPAAAPAEPAAPAAPDTPEVPAADATPSVVTPDVAAAEPAAEASLPKLEVPTFPTDEPAKPAEAPAEPEPTATPPAETPTPELPKTESTAEEQATVNSQIEDFIKNNAVEVSEEASTPPPNSTTDRVMQESVDTLIASTEQGTPDATATAPATEAAPAEPAPATPPADAAAPAKEESSDGVTIAHKKVIARPGGVDKPDLNELLAREQAKDVVAGASAPQVIVSTDTPATPADTPDHDTPGQTPMPGNTFTPKPNDDTDPNSIAL